MADSTIPVRQPVMGEEVRRYFEAHPELAARLRAAEKLYQTFGSYLRLTQPRVIVRQSAGENAAETVTDKAYRPPAFVRHGHQATIDCRPR